MQVSNMNNNTAIAVKATHNTELRRFALERPSFSLLEQYLYNIFSLNGLPLSITFQQDGEGQARIISSDQELISAVQLATGSPLRLSVELASERKEENLHFVPQADQQHLLQEREVKFEEYKEVEIPAGPQRGKGRGRGKIVSIEARQVRVEVNRERLIGRIQEFEKRLENPSLPAERQEIIRSKLVKLRQNLDAANEKATKLTQLKTAAPVGEKSSGNRGCGRGRGRRGNGLGNGVGNGRGRGKVQRAPKVQPFSAESGVTEDKSVTAAIVNFHQCKADLKEARKSGDPEALARAQESLKQAKLARREKMAQLVGPQRAHYRHCVGKFKEAKKNSDEDLEKEAHNDLLKAINDLKISKKYSA